MQGRFCEIEFGWIWLKLWLLIELKKENYNKILEGMPKGDCFTVEGFSSLHSDNL